MDKKQWDRLMNEANWRANEDGDRRKVFIERSSSAGVRGVIVPVKSLRKK